MLTVSGRSSPFLSVGESSLCDIVYAYRANLLSQHQLCKSEARSSGTEWKPGKSGLGAGPE
jgi:hypothetical protein